MLDGELTLVVDGAEHAVATGGAASFPGDRPHTYRNDGAVPCRFVMVVLQTDADLQAWASSRLVGSA